MKRPDHIDVTGKTLGRIFFDPVTWLPFLPIAGLYAFFGVPWWVTLPLCGAAGFFLYLWWWRRWGYVKDQVKVDLNREHFQKENEKLESELKALPAPSGFYNYGREALRLKRNIEDKILEDGFITMEEQDVAKLVSRLSKRVMDEAARGGKLPRDSQDYQNCLHDLEIALKTMSESDRMFHTIIDPLASGKQESDIEDVTSQLADKIQHAVAVKDYMAETLRENERFYGAVEEENENQNEVRG